MHRRAFLAGAPLALAACSSEPIWAPDDVVNRAIYRTEGPRSLTLYTMKNVGSGSGAHTSLMVDASQRVLFDPAGSFHHPIIPERNDVLIGMSEALEQYYVSYHARETFYVVGQKVFVSPQVAEMALQLVMRNGAVAKANCTRATSAIVRQLPGFESVGGTWFPNSLEGYFAEIPGVITREYRENDADDKSIAAAEQDAAIRAAVTAGR
jgi:hypothetical protein